MNLSSLWDLFCLCCGIACVISLVLYLFPILRLSFAAPQNLRAKYGQWAVVTGGSSGIGKAIVSKLASQGVNVYIVALDDDLLRQTQAEVSKQFPDVQVLSIPTNLGGNAGDYVAAVANATKDTPIAILVNNAGFLRLGFFQDNPIDLHAANIECNAVAPIRLTYLFYQRMIDQGIKGCIAFTSSAVFYLPSPFASMYGATKAMLSTFATTLAIEAKGHDIDVTVFHPSYTHSNLYAEQPKLQSLNILSKFGWTADDVADVVFSSMGRIVVRDMGAYAILTNLFGRLIDANSIASVMPHTDPSTPEDMSSGAEKKST